MLAARRLCDFAEHAEIVIAKPTSVAVAPYITRPARPKLALLGDINAGAVS